jgi:hypothetical protein
MAAGIGIAQSFDTAGLLLLLLLLLLLCTRMELERAHDGSLVVVLLISTTL